MLKKIFHKKNEVLENEFFADIESSKSFNFTNAKNLYIELKNGDVSPLTALQDDIRKNVNIYVPYIPENQKPLPLNIKTLNDITPNLSKYIPEDSVVLFLTQEDTLKYSQVIFKYHLCGMLNKITLDIMKEKSLKKLTIFLLYGTQSELQKVNEIVKELGVKEVNLFVLHCFVENYLQSLCADSTHEKLELSFKIEKDHFIDFLNEHDMFFDESYHDYSDTDDNFNDCLSYKLRRFDQKNVLISIYISDTLLSPSQAKEQYLTQLIIGQPKNIWYSEYTGGFFSAGNIKINNHSISDILKQYSGKHCVFQIEEIKHTSIFIDKLITTNSTGVLEPQDTERLKVIDCFEIFEGYLREGYNS